MPELNLTTMSAEELINAYGAINEQKNALEKQTKKLRDQIIYALKKEGMSNKVTMEFIAEIEQRTVNSIPYTEAQMVMPADMLAQLTHVSQSFVLSVKRLPHD